MIRLQSAKHSQPCSEGCFHKRRHEHVRPFFLCVCVCGGGGGGSFFFSLCVCVSSSFVIVVVVLWYPATMPIIGSLCGHSFSLSLFLFLVQDGNLRALVTGRSLFRLPLSRTTFLLTSDSVVLSHSSKRLLNHFSLLLPTLSYSNPFKSIGCCN